jgi:cytochrome c peroxidase
MLIYGIVAFLCIFFAHAIPLHAGTIRFDHFRIELPEGLDRDAYYVPSDNPMTKEKVELGRSLFFDTRLSFDNTVSCATCHSPRFAFADGQRVSLGVNAQEGVRNAPTVINRAFSREQFWDGRASSLEEQSKGPLVNPVEMAMPSLDFVENKLRGIKGYREWFKRVFGRELNIDDVARAIAAFERTILSGNSRFDRFRAGDATALNDSERRGLALFEGKARCSQCHSGFNFTDEKYHNIGIDWDTSLIDLGRYKVSGEKLDFGAFKTPTLREIAHTAPYMHNGTFTSLEEVVSFYNKGGVANPFLDVEMRRPKRTLEEILRYYEEEKESKEGKKRSGQIELARLNLTKQEQADLVAFLKALSGEGWQHVRPPESFPAE